MKCVTAKSVDDSNRSPDSICTQAANSVRQTEMTAVSLPGDKTNQRTGERTRAVRLAPKSTHVNNSHHNQMTGGLTGLVHDYKG